MNDKFLGAWLVSEYVYNPDGSFAGIVRQRRELLGLANGRIRVTQHCQPDAALTGHPMAAFTGSPVFELSVDGRYRRYHGPAVVGTGIPWDAGALTGRGLWPEFGHNFRSFAILPIRNRQLTGGKFFNASEMIANITGVAVPEDQTDEWPTLGQTYWPSTTQWHGTIRTVSPTGEMVQETSLQRIYNLVHTNHLAWEDSWDGQTHFVCAMHSVQAHFQVNGQVQKQAEMQGLGKTFGPMLEIEAVVGEGFILELIEVLDAEQHIVGMRRWLCDGVLEYVEILRLQPRNQNL